jgi:hypothetical protein
MMCSALAMPGRSIKQKTKEPDMKRHYKYIDQYDPATRRHIKRVIVRAK